MNPRRRKRFTTRIYRRRMVGGKGSEAICLTASGGRPIVIHMKSAAADEALGLVCNLHPSGRNDRRVAVQDLLKLVLERREIESGVVLHFTTAENTARLELSFVLTERQCCDRFRCSIVFDPGSETHSLAVEADGDLIAPLKLLYSAAPQA